ncbi:MAG: hypothetical protein LBT20_06860, partial [Clostridiales bacterium]|nr:hypothetical protein [Clostridiales bacterium]
MTNKQFKHDLFMGLGSALVWLKSCPDPMYYRDIVLYACVHNTTYDAQCEGTREVYLYQAISFVG